MNIENNILKKVKNEDIVNGTIVIPEGITEISNNAFMDCHELKNIVIPDSVKKIGKLAFVNCINLKSVQLPKDLTDIQEATFKDCESLLKIEIPEAVTNIGYGAFQGCSRLGDVKLGSNLENIDSYAFYRCESLSNINLPESLKTIGNSSFNNCRGLKSIVIPSKITKIPKDAFYYCDSLKDIKFPEGLTEIGDHAFFLCTELKTISLPESLKEIEKGAFRSCFELREAVIPKNVVRIGADAFEHCEKLHKVVLPEGLKSLGETCFSRCYWLQSINLPDSLETIEEGTFKFSYMLRNVNIPKNLKSIPKQMFHSCVNLREIEIPESVKEIGSEAFYRCEHLKNINFSEGLEEIRENAFEDCKSLKVINLPSSLKGIGESAFQGCFRLKNFEFPAGIENLGLNFLKDCKKIKTLTIPESIKSFKNPNDSYFSFVEKSNDGFVLSKQPGTDSYLIDSINIKVPMFFKYKDINPNLLKEQKNEHIADFYNTFMESLSEKQIEDFMKDHNFTFFKQVMKLKPEPGYIDRFNKMGFYTGLYNLGCFKPRTDFYGIKIDYSQKVSGKLLEYINKETYNPFDKLASSFAGMKPQGFKKDFTDFYLDKIYELMAENYYNEEFISRAYNDFEEVQATNTSNHGGQRQLKPTIEKFKSYFKENKFKNVTPETEPIARLVASYFDKQIDFDKAVEIMNEIKEGNIPANILSKPLKQENPFGKIDETAGKIGKLQSSTTRNLVDVATNEFTYEWLEKNDPTNLILGKLCSCCAHLHGAGFGIMHASMVHPNVQNLVVRNEEGKIIAKSTLFVNPEEQYGVLNNFEVYNGLPYMQYKATYEKFMKGIADFANQYNLEHPDKPLKQINVGGCHNDLINFVRQNNEESIDLLKALDYSNYGYDVFNYNGDSFDEQYIVWKNKELLKENELTKIVEKQS